MILQHTVGRYFFTENGKSMAEINYSTINNGKTYSIDSIIVDPQLRGQGIAATLLDTVINEAREKHLTVHPICTYARQAFFNHPDKYQDIIYKP